MSGRALSICFALALALAAPAIAQTGPAAPAPPSGGEHAATLTCQVLPGGVMLFSPTPSAREAYNDCDPLCAQALAECAVLCQDDYAFRCGGLCHSTCVCGG